MEYKMKIIRKLLLEWLIMILNKDLILAKLINSFIILNLNMNLKMNFHLKMENN